MTERGVAIGDDFSGGDWGDVLDADRAPANTFKAHNMLVYETGLLGPRPGLARVVALPAGLPRMLRVTNSRTESGAVWGLTVIGDRAYRVDLDNGVTGIFGGDLIGGVTGLPIGAWADAGTDNVYLAVAGDKLYRVGIYTADGVAALTGSPGARLVARNGVRIVAAGVPGEANKLYFSDAGDPDTWDALNFEFIGDAAAITFVHPLRSTLVVGKTTGWIGVGGLGSGAPFAQPLQQTPGPTTAAAVAMSGSGEMGFVAGDGTPVPGIFDGANANQRDEYRFEYVFGVTDPVVVAEPPFEAPTMSVVRAGRKGLAYLGRTSFPAAPPFDVGPSLGWLYDGKRWTRHIIGPDMGMWAAPGLHQVFDAVAGGYPHDYAWGIRQDVAPTALLRWRLANVTRPGMAGDGELGWPTDDGLGIDHQVDFPTVRQADGRYIAPRNIVLDLERFYVGTPDDHAVGVAVTTVGRYEGGSSSTGATFGYTADGSDEGPLRITRRLNGAWGRGVRLGLNLSHGVALRGWEIEYEVSTSRRGPA